MKPGSGQGPTQQQGEVLKRIHEQYGPADEKARDPVKKLGKDEFFKLMVTQIQHQDPLKPYQNEEMAAQLAQFSSVEQMVNMNANIERLAQAQQPLHHLGAANLIGKFVTTDSSRILHTEGKYSDINFEVPVDAEKVRVLILNERGETVKEIEQSGVKKGSNKVTWDGKKSNNLPAKGGAYTAQISVENDKGVTIPVQSQKTDLVHGISFDGKETILLTGDVRSPQKTFLKDVSRIVDNPQALNQGAKFGLSADLLNNLNEAPKESVDGISPGQANQFAPVNLKELQPEESKDVIRQHFEHRKPMANSNTERMEEDFSAHNAAAKEMKEKSSSGAVSKSNDGIDSINPAARAMGLTEENVAVGKRQPTSEEGSTVGKWGE